MEEAEENCGAQTVPENRIRRVSFVSSAFIPSVFFRGITELFAVQAGRGTSFGDRDAFGSSQSLRGKGIFGARFTGAHRTEGA